MNSQRRIKTNKAQCMNCLDIIESTHVHNFKSCKCGAINVDGGTEYLNRGGALPWVIELSTWTNDNPKIKTNKAQCRQCNDIITSTHVHDFKECKCGEISVDGGKEYLRRGGDLLDIIELSEYEG